MQTVPASRSLDAAMVRARASTSPLAVYETRLLSARLL
jgi:hypothetical protein